MTMSQGALIDTMEYDIKNQDETIKKLEEKAERYENTLRLIANSLVGDNTLRYIRTIKTVANEAIIEVEKEEIEVTDRIIEGV